MVRWHSCRKGVFGDTRENPAWQTSYGCRHGARQLAAELRMSLIPVSEALQRLQHDGLVESKPRVGTRVRVPTPEDIRGQYNVREALECHAARLFAEKASPRERIELTRSAEQLDLFLARDSTKDDPDFNYAVHGSHFNFHMRIAECAGSGLLKRLLRKNIYWCSTGYSMPTVDSLFRPLSQSTDQGSSGGGSKRCRSGYATPYPVWAGRSDRANTTRDRPSLASTRRTPQGDLVTTAAG